MASQAEAIAIRTALNKVVEGYKANQAEHSKLVKNRQELTAKYGETETVLEELKRLEADANVYKAVGPVLVKQDLMEAKSNVSNRLDYIKKDIDRLESQIKSMEGKMLEGEKEMMRLQKKQQTAH